MGANHEATVEALKASPPLTVVGLTLGGIPLQEWVYMLTILYLVMQIGWFAFSKFIRKSSPDND